MTSNLLPFTASNGYMIIEELGDILIKDDRGRDTIGPDVIMGERLSPSEMLPLREFFQAERDAELGRWRSKIDPDVFVQVNKDTYLGQVDFINERTLEVTRFARWESDLLGGRDVYSEFFAAHPEPKPWFEAKPGEVWALTVNGKESAWSISDEASVWVEATTERILDSAPRSPAITDGRRIWPEDRLS